VQSLALISLAGIVVGPVAPKFLGFRTSRVGLTSLLRWPLLYCFICLGSLAYCLGRRRDQRPDGAAKE